MSAGKIQACKRILAAAQRVPVGSGLSDSAFAEVVAAAGLAVGGLALARALGPGKLSDRVLRAAKSAVV